MASTLRVDQIQTSTGSQIFSSDGSVMSLNQRIRLPHYTTANLPSNALTGELVFDQDEQVVKAWNGTGWQFFGQKKVDSIVFAMHYKIFTDSFAPTAEKTYQNHPGSALTFSTKETGSSFLLMMDIPGYQAGTSSGVNAAFTFNGTLYGGTNGGGGDTWMAAVHSGISSGAFNMKKTWVVEPNLAANSTVNAYVACGHWSGTSSNHYFNYPGYSPTATFTVIEYKNI